MIDAGEIVAEGARGAFFDAYYREIARMQMGWRIVWSPVAVPWSRCIEFDVWDVEDDRAGRVMGEAAEAGRVVAQLGGYDVKFEWLPRRIEPTQAVIISARVLPGRLDGHEDTAP